MKDSIINSNNQLKPKEEIIVKKERNELKVDKQLKEIIDNPEYSDFLKEYALRRQNYSRMNNFFYSIKTDLDQMIKEKRLIIQSNVAIGKDYTKQNRNKDDNFVVFQFSYNSKELKRKASVSKTICPDQNEEKFYIWFKEINNAIINDCNQLNKMEAAEVKKLIKKVEDFCQLRFDKMSESYLVESGITSVLMVSDILKFYQEKKDPQIIEWVDRKMNWKYPQDKEAIWKLMIEDLDQMLEKGRLALPLSFNLQKDQSNKNIKYLMVFSRKIDNVDTLKNMTVDLADLNENEIQRIWVSIFDFLKFNYSERVDESQREMLISKIDKLHIEAKIDKQTENYLVDNNIISGTAAVSILEMYNNKNSQIIEWLDRRMDLRMSNDRDTIQGHFLTEIEQMTLLKRHTLPVTFNICMDRMSGQQVCFVRKVAGKQQNKWVSVKLAGIDKFECFRMWELIFEWMTKVFGLSLDAEQLEELGEKIARLQETVASANDEDDEDENEE